jgi:hypothetical protein
MADHDEDGAKTLIGLEAQPNRGRVGERDVLNPADERDVARVSENVDVPIGHRKVQPKGVMFAHDGAA